ncbi:MAG: hypothetical protein EOO31_04965 [Comamonadaceae bacterium]|nr:MAG: hypothetical protein EOO31_04965 [Comamonadaceae bacterium]
MNSHELLLRMTDASAPTPAMTDLFAVYAALVGSVAGRLTPDEVESFVALGVALQRQGRRYIPLAALE